MDNASYHSRIDPENRSPTTKNTKEQMKNWLIEKGIPFSDTLLKPEIYSIIKQNKPPKVYAIDKIIESKGHMVVRLPHTIVI